MDSDSDTSPQNGKSKHTELPESPGTPEEEREAKKRERVERRRQKKEMEKRKKEDKGYKISTKTTYPPISLDNELANHTNKMYANNYLKTAKYTPWNFIPKNLFEQFRRVTNMFFLLIAVLVCIPQVSPITPYTSIMALIFVLLVAAINDGYQDYKRFKADMKVNNEKFWKLSHETHQRVKIASKDIKVGDILWIEQNRAFPCDIVILASALPEGACYVETAQLDGETNLKDKRALPITFDFNEEQMSSLKGVLECIPPSEHLDNFEATITLDLDGKEKKAAMTAKQLLLRGTVLRDTEWIIGIVAYCGNDSKLALNQRAPPSKFSSLDKKINKIVLGASLMVILMSGLEAILSNFWERDHPYSYLNGGSSTFVNPNLEGLKNFFRYFVLFSWLVPISLMVSLEIVKFIQGVFMEWDTNMALDPEDTEETGMKVRSNGLNDELALVRYVFSDKTGTLTENRMEFKKSSVRGTVFHRAFEGELSEHHKATKGKKEHESASDYLLNLALCHTVMADTDKETGELIYKGQSPDEQALVKAAAKNGFVFKRTSHKGMVVEINGRDEVYELIAAFEFTADRRRMSVLLRTPGPDSHVVLYCKGADTMMYSRLGTGDDEMKKKTLEDLHLFSTEGLRTLVLAKKVLTDEEAAAFEKAYTTASQSLEKRQEKVDALADKLESDLTIIGATAIEDKLQEGVPETIAYLLEAGISVWVITGDKQETAINIAKSSNLVKPTTPLHKLNAESTAEAKKMIEELNEKATVGENGKRIRIAVITDGGTLKFVLKDHQQAFLKLVPYCSAVVCCRVTPKQKAKIVSMIKRNSTDITLAIGDGANDVSMIQEAHIGVGIFGKEGTQAARTSDYAIRQFSHLQRLISVHGRYSAIRNSQLVHFSFYKNFGFALGHFWFSFFSGYSGLTLYDDWIMTFYNLFLTSLPPLFVGIFDWDLSPETIAQNPRAFREVQKGIFFNNYTIAAWLMSGTWHSIVLFMLGFGVFWRNDSLAVHGREADLAIFKNSIQTCALIVPLLKFAMEMITFNGFIWFGIYGSMAGYFLLLALESAFLDSIPDQYAIFELMFQTPAFYFLVFISIVIALTPDFVVKYVHRSFFPDNWQILQEYELVAPVGLPVTDELDLRERADQKVEIKSP